jgi:hypothetical protein
LGGFIFITGGKVWQKKLKFMFSQRQKTLMKRRIKSMPWFNMERYDWKVPDEDDEKHLMGNDLWWAVMVKFYY